MNNIRQILGSLFYWLYIPLGAIYSCVKIYINNQKIEGVWLDKKTVKDKKNSDTIFILGSGSSINEYSSKQWQDIYNNDSLGFNFWILHDFVPSFYMFELPSDKNTKEFYLEKLRTKSLNYDSTITFLKEGNKGKKGLMNLPAELRTKVGTLFNPTIPMIRAKHIDFALKTMLILLNIFKKLKTLIVFNKRASLFSAIIFSYLLGYKNIVLCGVDLNNSSYFYENNTVNFQNNKDQFEQTIESEKTHKTDDVKYGEVTISKLIERVDNVILKPNNISLYIGTTNSSLASILPYYWEQNDEDEV